MWVCGQYFSGELIGRIGAVVQDEPSLSRRSLSRRICTWLDWRAPDGRLQEMSCRKALVELEACGVLTLPAPSGEFGFERRRTRPAEPVVEVADVACSLEDLGHIEIVPVSSRYAKASRVWNGLLERFHYLGSGPLVGAQIRYLMRCESQGWIGAFAFSAAAKRLKARDKWIGWSERARHAHLQQVVCNSRLLIPETVRVANLASHVLAQALDRLPEDWRTRYGYRPVLVETFVDPKRHQGTCYRAANWIHVGQTAGRSSPFPNGTTSTGKKDIYVCPLTPDWQSVLQAEPPRNLFDRPAPEPEADWVEVEFGRVELYDQRLKRRLYTVARDFYAAPGALIPDACQGSEAKVKAKVKAAYRLMNNPRIDLDIVLRSHVAATAERIREHDVVLAVQDTTTLNYGTQRLVNGLGPINNKGDKAVGLLLHNTQAFTVQGTPLGVLDAQCWARDPKQIGKAKLRHQRPIEDKESIKWIRSYRAVAEVQRHCPDTMLVVVGDRESDIYELFAEAANTPEGPELLIRAERSRNRKVGDDEGGYLWHRVAQESPAGYMDVHVPRQHKQPARTAHLTVRFKKVTLKPPKDKKLPPLQIWAVYVREEDCGPEVKSPLEWMLLTTVEISDFGQATTIIKWYTRRWGIEIYHRVLKSGCRVEVRRLNTADGLETALIIDLVVAWRILNFAKLGRETPDVPCTVLLEDDEWRALYWYVTEKPPPNDPIPLQQAVRMIASLGGFLGRKCDGEPGPTTIWRGLERVLTLKGLYRILTNAYARDGPTTHGLTCG